MILKHSSTVLAVSGFALVALSAITGCSNNAQSTSAEAGSETAVAQGVASQGDASLVAEGKRVVQANGCLNCHAIGGEGGGKAPDLSRVGADPEHTPEWLVAHVKNPKTHNPGSRMPSFEGKISDKDLKALGAYLASLK